MKKILSVLLFSTAVFTSAMADDIYLPASMPTLDGTFWVDTDGKPYMVFCYEWLQNNNGTMEMIELKPDLSGSIPYPNSTERSGGKLLFRASDSPWSKEKAPDGTIVPNKVTDGPFLFRTGTGRLGMIWTSWIYKDYTQGVAYSESGRLEGPWVQEKDPITPPNFGHGMIFKCNRCTEHFQDFFHNPYVGKVGYIVQDGNIFGEQCPCNNRQNGILSSTDGHFAANCISTGYNYLIQKFAPLLE